MIMLDETTGQKRVTAGLTVLQNVSKDNYMYLCYTVKPLVIMRMIHKWINLPQVRQVVAMATKIAKQ